MNTSIVPIATQKILERTPEKILGIIRENSVIVVPGLYDRVQDILSGLSIPYTVPLNLERTYLKPNQILMINCSRNIRLNSQQIQMFVRSGGWLITSDWALDVIEQCFPRMIQYTGYNLPEDVVTVTPVYPQLTEKMTICDFWIDGGSHPFQILDQRSVIPIIESHEMEKKYKTTPYICVGFQYGNGKVFHMLSHFILQKSKSKENETHDNINVIQFLINILTQKGIRQ